MAILHQSACYVITENNKTPIATKLMRVAHHNMKTIYGAKYCSLHVRMSNRAALGMYADVLKYEIVDLEYEYYADKEHAYDMNLFFDNSIKDQVVAASKKEHAKKKAEKLREK